MKTKITCAICATLLTAGQASAQTFKYNAQDLDHDSVINPGNIGYQSSIAYIDDFALMYNPASKTLNVSATYSKNNANPDGFWFVVSDGPDPKNNVNEYAIFYFDASQPSAVVSAYVYDGTNSGNSWNNPGNLFASSLNAGSGLTASASTSGSQTSFQFTADVSKINNKANWPASYNLSNDWDGAQFDQKVGIWFHTFTLEEAAKYNSDGSLKELKIKNSDYFDVANQMTVPEPSALLLGALGAVSLLIRRKR